MWSVLVVVTLDEIFRKLFIGIFPEFKVKNQGNNVKLLYFKIQRMTYEYKYSIVYNVKGQKGVIKEIAGNKIKFIISKVTEQ